MENTILFLYFCTYMGENGSCLCFVSDERTMRLLRGAEGLPALQIMDEVCSQLAVHDCLVVTAPPGAGKSTLLPLAILRSLSNNGKVLMLEPRRLAARQIAERMAYMLNETVGNQVGYRVRFENCVSVQSRLEVITEGILTRMLIADPFLEDVSVVIFDEFHERSLQSDVAFALTREVQRMVRPDLKIVILSATIDADSLCSRLNAGLVQCEGRMYPVDIRMPQSVVDGTFPELSTDVSPVTVAKAVAQTILLAHREQEGDILAFLPGETEIRRCADLLVPAFGCEEGKETTTCVCPLYGMLPWQDQQKAISPSPPGKRKIVLATSIAETSLTIEGVRVVVDSGLCRRQVFNAGNGLSSLQTVRISMDMAMQRSGRAGRVAPGVCYRMWSLATEHRMNAFRTPEIEDADLTAMLLDIAAWGENRMEQLQWLTIPPVAHVSQASSLLFQLGALDIDGRITRHGRSLAALPCHPRIAQMLVSGKTDARKALAADIAAILEERDPMTGNAMTADLNARISLLRSSRSRWYRLALASEQYRRMVHVAVDDTLPSPLETGALLAAAWPDRVARAQGTDGRYRLASGGFATLDRNDDLSSYEWIVVADMHAGGNDRIFLASPVDTNDLTSLICERDTIAWDARMGTVVAQRERHIGCLILSSQSIREGNRDQMIRAIGEAAVKQGLTMFDFSDRVINLQRRVASVAAWHPEMRLPDLSTEAVLGHAVDWLPSFIGKASSVAELRKIDMAAVLWSLLTWEQQQAVEHLAPSHIEVATGSRIRVEYRQGSDLPVVRVRLQECFGMEDTPRVDDGRKPVLMELLSPGFKPVQLTQDLRSFWQTAYFEIRKELRRRYPKHAWPDNPQEAVAVRGVNRNKTK